MTDHKDNNHIDPTLLDTQRLLLGVDLPEEQLKQLADGVRAKLNLDKAGDFLGGLLGKK